ncbi:MAG: phosphohydrolase [Deltaproteobacteria bacterium]|nr:phosphohydrolase [Deltaproteobacteria bacterium]MBW2658122.1 phosphohydrolase [Deltaproteobacteria bacterium]
MKCPGQDMQYWTDSAIFDVECPECGERVEFYKDDTSRKCGHCGHRFVNPKMDFGCAAYCPFAEQCLGTLPEEFAGARDNLLKDKVAVEVKRYYKTDFKRISRTMKIARYAENIGKSEGGNLAVILCASYLNGIELPVAESILKKLSADETMIKEVSELLTQHKNGEKTSSIESKIIHDAVLLQNFQNNDAKEQQGEESNLTNQLFTSSARDMIAEFA